MRDLALVQLSPQQFVSWDEPIEMLYACHQKVKQFCRQLQLLPEYLAKNGCNEAVKRDIQQILTYFNQSAPLHHDDEEQDFFPALMKVLPQVKTEIDALEAQHLELHQSWDHLSLQLVALLNGERTEIEEALINRFVENYALHIALEEPLFELGREHLSEPVLHAMGKIMAERRKV